MGAGILPQQYIMENFIFYLEKKTNMRTLLLDFLILEVEPITTNLIWKQRLEKQEKNLLGF